MSDDILRDYRERLLSRLGPGAHRRIAEHLDEVEREMRRDYGAERHYVARSPNEAIAWRCARDQRIVDGWRRGDSVRLLARRFGISDRQVRRVLRAAGLRMPEPEAVPAAPAG